jgi:hypothetical protein
MPPWYAGTGKPSQGEEEISGDSTPSHINFTGASTCTPGPWSVCILNQDGEIILHRNMQTSPEMLLRTMAPYRADIVVAVACLWTWELARRPLRSGRDPLCPGACPLHEGAPWGPSETRHDRWPQDRSPAPWWHAIAGLRLSHSPAGDPGSAAADASHAHARGVAHAHPTYPSSVVQKRRNCSTLPNGIRSTPVTTGVATSSRDQPHKRAHSTIASTASHGPLPPAEETTGGTPSS